MMEKFSEMKYVRPDGEAYIQTIQKETKNFNEAADFEGCASGVCRNPECKQPL